MSRSIPALILLFYGLAIAAAPLHPGYAEARRAFLAAVDEHAQASPPAQLFSFPIASPTEPSGDPDLTVDAAYFDSGGPDLVVLQSGLHGVEGPAGSRLQIEFMRTRLAPFLARGISVLVIHALNPWGFAHLRRTDAENVNLNRNFSRVDSLFRSTNEGYSKLRGVLEPGSPVGSRRLAYIRARAKLIGEFFKTRFDRRGITLGMNGGQYESARGLNYGGSKPQAQTAILERILEPAFAGKRRVVFVDIHTGLGDAGVLHLMPAGNSDEALREALATRVGAARSPLLTVTATGDNGFYPTRGDVTEFAAGFGGARILALTAEFGTVGSGFFPQLYSAALLITENQAHHYGCVAAGSCAAVLGDFTRLFDPESREWRARVSAGAGLLYDQILALLN